jgi:hypothetical protein
MTPRRWLVGGALLMVWLLLAVAGCDSGDGSSPFRNLGKRGDSALPGNASRPAPR